MNYQAAHEELWAFLYLTKLITVYANIYKGFFVETQRERALKSINQLRDKYELDDKSLYSANESKTRLLIIDEVLSALGWAKEEFNPEEVTISGQYIDYLLKVDGFPRLIIEAKRVGNTFSQIRKLHKNLYAVSYVKSAFGSAFGEVLEQAQGYASQTQVPYGVITNGLEWFLITLIPPPGGDVSELKCVYFGNLFSEHHNFDLMWEFLSKNAIISGVLEEEFNAINPLEADISITPSDSLGELIWKDNSFNDEYVNEFYDRFFGDINDSSRRNMLTHCFVTSSKIEQYQGQLKRLLSDSAPLYIENAKEISPGEHDQVIFTSGDQKGRVIIVAGSVGAGKTTFITKARIENRNNKTISFVCLNLIDEGVFEKVDDEAVLWNMVCDEWLRIEPDSVSYSILKQTFHSEIDILKKGEYSEIYKNDNDKYLHDEAEMLRALRNDSKKFLERSWKFYRKQRNIQILLVLDNVDRTSEVYQRYTYSFAHKISTVTGANVIVTMREGTFYRGKDSGFLDVRSNDMVFHLQAPDVPKVLSRRVKYIEEHLDDDFRWKEWRKQSDEEKYKEALYSYAKIIKNSFLSGRDSARSCEILAATSWHNVRKFLELLKRVHKYSGADKEEWPIEDVLNSLILASDFDLRAPITGDLFKPVFERQRCYFLKIRVLIYLSHGLKAAESQRGVKYSKLLKFVRGYGYRDSWLQKSMEEMVQERFLECMELPTEESYTQDYAFDRGHTFRISPLGVILSEMVSSESSYLINTGWNLPFYDNGYARSFISKTKSTPVDSARITSDDLRELIANGVSDIVAKYLSESLKFEAIKHKNLESIHEYHVVEEILSKKILLDEERDQTAAKDGSDRDDIQLAFDLPRFEEFDDEVTWIEIPEKIFEKKYMGSSSLPKILWALVHLRSKGKYGATGAEITRTINVHLLDDHHHVEPTNISRALRSPIMRKQTWLLKEKSKKGKSTIFSLGAGWEAIWVELFLSRAPSVE